MKLTLLLLLFIYSCSIGKEYQQMKFIDVTLVEEIVGMRLVGTSYKQFNIYIYEDERHERYELLNYEGLRARIYVPR